MWISGELNLPIGSVFWVESNNPCLFFGSGNEPRTHSFGNNIDKLSTGYVLDVPITTNSGDKFPLLRDQAKIRPTERVINRCESYFLAFLVVEQDANGIRFVLMGEVPGDRCFFVDDVVGEIFLCLSHGECKDGRNQDSNGALCSHKIGHLPCGWEPDQNPREGPRFWGIKKIIVGHLLEKIILHSLSWWSST